MAKLKSITAVRSLHCKQVKSEIQYELMNLNDLKQLFHRLLVVPRPEINISLQVFRFRKIHDLFSSQLNNEEFAIYCHFSIISR